jgi:hypothetical protein
MKKPFDYSVSLRVKHPLWTAADIASRLNRTPKHSWTVGEPKKTPKGTPLDGLRTETYCCFDIDEGRDGEFASCLRRAVSDLRQVEVDLRELCSSGGTLMFYVFWYPNGDTGEIFETELLLQMASLGIELGINVYDDRSARSAEADNA